MNSGGGMIPPPLDRARANLYQSNGGVQAHHPPRTIWRNRDGLTRPATLYGASISFIAFGRKDGKA